MTGLETKDYRPGLVVAEGAAVSGYASVFGVRDQGGDIVMPGAYAGADALAA